jgi:hypothetical protein
LVDSFYCLKDKNLASKGFNQQRRFAMWKKIVVLSIYFSPVLLSFPFYQLTFAANVETRGDLKITGAVDNTGGSGITFPDGSTQTKACSGCANGVLSISLGGTGTSIAPAEEGQFLRSISPGYWGIGGIQAADLPSLSGSYLDLTSTQTITGSKTFSNTGVGVAGIGATGVSGSGTSSGYGVSGSGGTGVYGTSTTNTGTGVDGRGATGVFGLGTVYGVYGMNSTNNSYGQLGTTQYSTPIGVYGLGTIGIYGESGSASGSAAVFSGNAAGKIISGRSSGVERFSVDGNGNLAVGGNLTVSGTITGKIYVKTVLVSPVGTAQQNGTALLNALAGITTASSTNPYLLKIEPGTYDIGANSLVMKPYVDIEGSGENTTTITSVISSSSSTPKGTVQGDNYAEIRFLTVENTGNGAGTAAIYNTGASPSILNVTAISRNGANSHGIYNDNYSSPRIRDVTAYVTGGNICFGVYNDISSPVMSNVIVSIHVTGIENVGVHNQVNSSPTMTNMTIDVDGAENNYGIYNDSYSSPTISNVTMTGSGHGIVNVWQCSPIISNVSVNLGGEAGEGAENYGIKNDRSSGTLTNIILNVHGGSSSTNYGVYNDSSFPTMTDFTIHAWGNGGTDYGVYNTDSSPKMVNVNVLAESGDNNYGVFNIGGAPVMRDFFTSATGGSGMNAAIRNESNSNVSLSNVTANASGGTYAFGLFNINTAGNVDINRSSFSADLGSGDTRGIRNDSTSTIKVGSSKISGTTVGSNFTCIYCYDGNYGALDGSCR